MESADERVEIPQLETEFTFRQRPMAIPADLRPGWRIGLIVLLLKNCCRAHKSSFARLHVLSWGFRTATGRRQLMDAAEGRVAPDAILARVEPFLNQAVDYAIGEGLVRRDEGGRIELTDPGRQFALELEATPEVFREEKLYISQIRSKVTESLVDRMFGG